jgi:hypothetical protein
MKTVKEIFWSNALKNFKWETHLHNMEELHIDTFIDICLQALVFIIYVTCAVILYPFVSFYQAFAPHRIYRRYKRAKEIVKENQE